MKVYKPSEIAALLKVSPNHITGLCLTGKVKACRVGRVWRIPAAEAERLWPDVFKPSKA